MAKLDSQVVVDRFMAGVQKVYLDKQTDSQDQLSFLKGYMNAMLTRLGDMSPKVRKEVLDFAVFLEKKEAAQ